MKWQQDLPDAYWTWTFYDQGEKESVRPNKIYVFTIDFISLLFQQIFDEENSLLWQNRIESKDFCQNANLLIQVNESVSFGECWAYPLVIQLR